jgi:acetylcholinesterase
MKNALPVFLARSIVKMTSGKFFVLLAALIQALSAEPVVHSKAGTFQGRYLPTFDQDVFLGIKYAPEPVRFTPSALIEDSPEAQFNASEYGVDCWGSGSDTNTLVSRGYTTLGEDCLHLNVIKPRTNETDLPVLVWIYGGGWQQGATSDPR